MTPYEGTLLSKSIYTGNDRVQVGNGSLPPITHVGSLNIPAAHTPLVLKRVLHVPSLKHNLSSVKQICQDNNCIVVFDDFFVCRGQNLR